MGGGGGLWAKYLLPRCCIGDSLCMQHGHVLKNLYFNLLTPKAREGGGVCGGNICYHVAAFVIPFKLDMQHENVLKKLILTFDPTPIGCLWLEGSGSKIFATTFLHS